MSRRLTAPHSRSVHTASTTHTTSDKLHADHISDDKKNNNKKHQDCTVAEKIIVCVCTCLFATVLTCILSYVHRYPGYLFHYSEMVRVRDEASPARRRSPPSELKTVYIEKVVTPTDVGAEGTFLRFCKYLTMQKKLQKKTKIVFTVMLSQRCSSRSLKYPIN